MAFRIEYKSSVWRDLRHLDKNIAKRILNDTEGTLASDPAAGIPLTGQFKGLFKLRIGDYRVIYAKTRVGVLILRIGPRNKVYNR